MATPENPNVVMVPVTRHDIKLSLEDILTPLTQMAAQLPQAAPAAVSGTELHGHVQELSDLAGKLKDVVGRINALRPDLLAPGRNRPGR